ncbi:MAG: penicillin-binding Tp47 domain C-containing protein [Coriobacteriia bacterium]|nr:penicillin-binding Tp47 domain C-containing protein [Coriobacteriia bacterium]
MADVDATTHGLKTATENADGSFSFSAAVESLTGSGIKDQSSLKKVTETTKEGYEAASDQDKAGKIYPIVAEIGGDVEPGAFGEMIRVDLDGDYGDLGSNLQSVTWTYYGNDSTGTNVVQTFGTKFAADNWMHKKMHIQLGLTDSIRCQFPEGYDGTGYWKLTVHALGYEDYTTSLFSISESNIDDGTLVTENTKQKLQAIYDQGAALTEKDYTSKTWNNLKIELGEAEELLAKNDATEAACSQQIKHVTEALNNLVKVIAKPTAGSTKLTYNGKQQSPFKDGAGYTVSGKQTNAGTYTAQVAPAKGYAWNAEGDTSAVSQSYTIAKANQSLTAKASTKTVKKAKVKKKVQKVSGAIKVTGAQGKVTYAKKSGSAKLSVASNGKITVKKKTKKGTYKVKVVVKAAGNGNYNAATKTVTVKVKVK